jgi:hypothetical protein
MAPSPQYNDESKCSGQSWGHWFWTLNFEGKQSHLLTLKTGENPIEEHMAI